MNMMKPCKKILIIDDDEYFARVLARSLERLGTSTVYAKNADKAIHLLSSERFDWISMVICLVQ